MQSLGSKKRVIEREDQVESLMQELGLVNMADSFVGDEENRGISDGERKRVSTGVDMNHMIRDLQILLLYVKNLRTR